MKIKKSLPTEYTPLVVAIKRRFPRSKSTTRWVIINVCAVGDVAYKPSVYYSVARAIDAARYKVR